MGTASNPVWLELVKMWPSVVAAITAIIGVVIAVRGLNRWRAETIGKRKAELAESALADFYEAKDLIDWARMPMAYPDEGTKRTKSEGETEQDTRLLNSYFVPIERLFDKSEFWSRFESGKYKFRAVFGNEAAKAYDELRAIHSEVIISAKTLTKLYKAYGVGAAGTIGQ